MCATTALVRRLVTVDLLAIIARVGLAQPGHGIALIVGQVRGNLHLDLDEQRAVYARIASNEHVTQREVRLNLPGRQGIATCLISGRLLNVDGEECALWSVVDITELRRIQADIEDLNRTLEQRVAARTTELSSALDTLRPLFHRLRLLTARADDTEMALGSDLSEAVLDGYRFAKAGGKGVALDALRAAAASRFGGGGTKSGDTPAPDA